MWPGVSYWIRQLLNGEVQAPLTTGSLHVTPPRRNVFSLQADSRPKMLQKLYAASNPGESMSVVVLRQTGRKIRRRYEHLLSRCANKHSNIYHSGLFFHYSRQRTIDRKAYYHANTGGSSQDWRISASILS